MFLIDDGMFCVLNLIIWDYIIVVFAFSIVISHFFFHLFDHL